MMTFCFVDRARREKAVIIGDLRPMAETLHQLLEASDKEKVTPTSPTLLEFVLMS